MVATKPINQALKIAGLAASVSLASLAISPEAHAVVITRTASFSAQNTEFPTPITFAKYNPILGETVTSIIIRITNASLSTSGTIRNGGTVTRNYSVTSTAGEFSLYNDPDPASANLGISVSGLPATIGTTQTFSSVAGGQTRIFANQTLSGLSGSFTVNQGSNLSALQGVGTFDLYPFFDIATAVTGGSTLITNLTTLASAQVTIDYNVTNATDVPEPTTMLGMLALTGTGAAMMKKFKTLVKLT